MPDLDPTALSARLEALERSVASLRDEVQALRAHVNGDRRDEVPGTGAMHPGRSPPPPALRPASHAVWTSDEVESVVGRYGMLALATLTGLAAIGTFLGWAITQGLLGPPARVALGLAVAGALGAAGLRLRRRERSFGATLLGLSLATTQLCAWAAGPLLALVPTWLALMLAAAVSIALAGFAQREDDEPLWCVGFGGAAVAPFVASPDQVSATLVAAYGLIVLLTGCYAIAGRVWPVASRVFAAVTALFVGALMAMPENQGGPLLAIGLPIVVAVAGVMPFVGRRSADGHRARLRTLGFFAAAAALRAAFGTRLPLTPEGVAGVVAAAGVVWLVILDRTVDSPAGDLLGGLLPHTATIAEWIDAAWVPLGFAVALVVAADAGRAVNGALAGASALALLALIARHPPGAFRDAAAFAAAVCALAAVMLAAERTRHGTTAAVAGVSVLLFAVHRARPSHSWVWAGGVALVAASLSALFLLGERPAYAYTPFGTRSSALALGIAACWAVSAHLAPHVPIGRVRTLGAASIAAWAWAFVWVHQEIARAVSPTVATLLLVTYYASTSVLAVGVGRARSVPGLRHVGLALGLMAAFTAVRGARSLDAVWAEILAYLVTSVFLLGIAYWYRKTDQQIGAARSKV